MALVILPARALERQAGDRRARNPEHVTDGWVALAEPIVKPIRPGAGHLTGELPDRPFSRGGPERELFRAEIGDGRQKPLLMSRPPLKEGPKDRRH